MTKMKTATNPMTDTLTLFWNEADFQEKMNADMEKPVPASKKRGRRRTTAQRQKDTWRIGVKRQQVASIYMTEVPADGYLRHHQEKLSDHRNPRHEGRDKRYKAELKAEMRDYRRGEVMEVEVELPVSMELLGV